MPVTPVRQPGHQTGQTANTNPVTVMPQPERPQAGSRELRLLHVHNTSPNGPVASNVTVQVVFRDNASTSPLSVVLHEELLGGKESLTFEVPIECAPRESLRLVLVNAASY